MNNATAVVALINKCDTPAAKARCEQAFQRASNLETTANDLQRYGQVFAGIVQSRKQEKEEAA